MALDPRSRVARTVQAIAGYPLFARVGPTVVRPIDRAVSRLEGRVDRDLRVFRLEPAGDQRG